MKIIIPTRPQVDTTIAIFILKTLGSEKYPDIGSATVEVDPLAKPGEGKLLLDVGGGELDHHGADTTATELVIAHLGLSGDRSLQKMRDIAERDDKEGKGTLSQDMLDKAFGLPGLITVLNKIHPTDPNVVVDAFLPILEAHYKEERKRLYEMPKEVDDLISKGLVETFTVKQRKKNLKVIFLDSDNTSLPGYLRASVGGGHDVVAQRTPLGHVNILTRPIKRVDLRSLTVLLKLKELTPGSPEAEKFTDPRDLSKSGHLYPGDNWYYDTATNSILNGGVNPGEIKPTKISKEDLIVLLKKGLSEEVWNPLER